MYHSGVVTGVVNNEDIDKGKDISNDLVGYYSCSVGCIKKTNRRYKYCCRDNDENQLLHFN